MSELPLVGRGYQYRGRNPDKRQEIAEKNETVAKIAHHANTLIANNSKEIQQLTFATIALDLEVDLEMVSYALRNSGSNGITLRVTPEDRVALERFRTIKSE